MKQYFISNGRLFFAEGEDIDNLEIKEIYSTSTHIDWAYYITEDGIIKYNDKEYQVKSGDIVLTLYVPETFDCETSQARRNIAVISNEIWTKTMLAWNERNKGCKAECNDRVLTNQ